MEHSLTLSILAAAAVSFIPLFWKFSPASKSTKVWTTLYFTLCTTYTYSSEFRAALASLLDAARERPLQALGLALLIAIPLKYIQRKLRFARLNALKWKHGFTDDPASYENMTVQQAQEVERNMAEWEFPRLWQFGWISDFFRVNLFLHSINPYCKTDYS
jgi:hypothetical protein